jgi:predicted TIM-barrel fold metal-dependent hydrolase
MKIDAHVYLGNSLFGYSQTAEEIIEKLDAQGVDRCVLCPVRPFDYHLEPENDSVSRTVKGHKDRFTGLVRVDPRQGEKALREMVRGIETLGLRGLYLNPWEESYPINSEMVYPLVEKAGQYHVPVMIRGGFPVVSHPSQIRDLVRRFPGTTFIATSAGQINISGGGLEDARILLTENKNVFMETSGIYREDFIEEMAKVLGAGRLLYGSASPVMDMSFEIQRVQRAHLKEKEKAQILGKNLVKLLGISSPG